MSVLLVLRALTNRQSNQYPQGKGQAMSWKDCDKVGVGGFYLKLAEDKESKVVAFMGEPIPRSSTFQGNVRQQALFPVFDGVGLKAWPVGSKLYNELKNRWESLTGKACLITRYGKPNDKSTTYKVELAKPNRAFDKALGSFNVADLETFQEQLAQATEAEEEVDIPI